MASGLLGVGTSGILSSQQQIQTTGHNISNVNTAGFARQRTETTTKIPSFSGSGYIGTGVQVSTTTRFYDQFLEDQIKVSNSQVGRLETFNNLSAQLDNILANPDAGLTPTLEAFFNSVQEANNFPAGVPQRSVMLTSAETLVNRFGLIQDRFIDLNTQVNTQLATVATEISSRAQSIADLNASIAVQIGAGQGNLPNDAMDQREQLIKEIAQRIDVTLVQQTNGATNVFIGSGQALVLNNSAFTLSVADSEFTPKNKELVLTGTAGSYNMTSQATGGVLQGLMDFKSQVLDPSFSSVGRIAASLSKEINEQHVLGMTLRQDPNGNYIQGANFFSDITTTIPTFASNLNSGNAAVNLQITDTRSIPTSDYQLVFDGANYNLTRLSDNLVFSAATIPALNAVLANTPTVNSENRPQGFSLSVASGAFITNDKYLIQPTHELARSIQTQVSDVLDIALASPIVTSKATDTFGVGTNTGSGNISFVPFQPTGAALTNIPITSAAAGAGNNVDIVLTYNAALSQFDVTTTGTPATAAVPAVVATAIPYTAANTGQTFSLAAPYADISFTLTGVPANGDSFNISNNQAPQDDNRNGLIMSNIQTQKILQNSSATLQGAYGLMVADVGTRTHSSEIDRLAQKSLNEQALANRNEMSGVNLDEEASNLLQFQQAYQSSARVISIADQIFKDLLGLI